MNTNQKYWADRNKDRLEDMRWMALTGEHAMGAAARLGISFVALESWAKRHDPESWALLIARNPADHNYRNAGKNQWNKEAS